MLDPGQLGRVLDGIRARRPVAPEVEITLEVNPDDVRGAVAGRWRAMGINRLSIGAQSFDPAVLEWMHRTHTVRDVSAAVAIVRQEGFANVSLDLIFAVPAHLQRDWTRDLDQALGLEPTHLSLYGLTVEQHTPLARWVERGETQRTDDESYATEFLEADRALVAAGFDHYEVSNAARPGFRSRHNSAYWKRRPFIGLGPSAHSGWDRERQWNIREWAAYAAAIAQGAGVMEAGETLSDEAVALENLYLGLRTSDGVPASTIPANVRERWIEEGWAKAVGITWYSRLRDGFGWMRWWVRCGWRWSRPRVGFTSWSDCRLRPSGGQPRGSPLGPIADCRLDR